MQHIMITNVENTMKEVGAYLRAVREARGLTLAAVACCLGHRNPVKGARRLKTIEATGVASGDMLVRLAEVLDLDWVEFEEKLSTLGWCDQPAYQPCP